MKAIANSIGQDRVKAVIDDFYERIQRHPTLAGPFEIVSDWAEHKAHLAHYWWVALGGRPYRDKPYRLAEKHEAAGFTTPLLEDWLALFRRTLADHLEAELAEQWHLRAAKLGRSMRLMHESIGWRYRRADSSVAAAHAR